LTEVNEEDLVVVADAEIVKPHILVNESALMELLKGFKHVAKYLCVR
jgi:hypothetical protein